MFLIRPHALVVLPVLVALSLAGCGTRVVAGTAATSTSPASIAVASGLPPITAIVGLHVRRLSPGPQDRVAPFEKTSTDVVEVQRLYAAVLKLKPFPADTITSCPLDIGVTYELDFLRQGAPTVPAFYGGGCPALEFQQQQRVLQIVDWTGFSQILAEALGVPVSSVALAGPGIQDSAPPGGPFAPSN
jgi:hypothetical protein